MATRATMLIFCFAFIYEKKFSLTNDKSERQPPCPRLHAARGGLCDEEQKADNNQATVFESPYAEVRYFFRATTEIRQCSGTSEHHHRCQNPIETRHQGCL